MAEANRVNMTMPDEMRDRFEAWRADQYKKTGRIPSQADAGRILVHRGLIADGFAPITPETDND